VLGGIGYLKDSVPGFKGSSSNLTGNSPRARALMTVTKIFVFGQYAAVSQKQGKEPRLLLIANRSRVLAFDGAKINDLG